MNRWARKYVGRPHAKAPDGDGPVRYSCWGLVRAAARERMSIELPAIEIEGEVPSEQNFTLLLRAARQTGLRPMLAREASTDDIVVMRGMGRLHCGYVIVEGRRVKVLHSSHERGVVCELWGDATRGMQVELWRRAEGGNGEPLVLDGVPQDRDGLRAGVQVLGAALAAYSGNVAGLAAFLSFGVGVLSPTVVPSADLPIGGLGNPTTGNSFSASLGGNTARLDQAIPKVCGRAEFNPPFACRPYTEYLSRPDDGESGFDSELDRDQYVFVLCAVGFGNHDLIAAKIGNTQIERFADVAYQYLPPGVQPSALELNGVSLTVQANVVTAEEISAQVLETGRFVGGFSICAPQRTATHIGVDIAATRGLGKGTDSLFVQWRVQIRAINDFGQVLSNWSTLATETREAFTSTPQRWTEKYELPDPGRYEARVVRLDVQDTDPNAYHEIAWIGLRAYLSEPAPLNADTAHFALIMRASSQLSAAAGQDIRLIVQAHCRPLDTDLEFDAEAYTRNPAWWLLDCATSATWGHGKPLSRVDAQSFYDLAQTCDARQDNFDYVFTDAGSGWAAMQLIARSCRARVFRRNGVISVARDELAEIPVTAFVPRNCQPGMAISEKHPTRRDPDGVIIEYQDYRTNEWTDIECPLPGVDLEDMVRPIRLRLPGVRGPTHARREGLFQAASLRYRRRICDWQTEMEGELPACMSVVDYLPDIRGYGRSGDVSGWDEGALTMTLTEPPDWAQAPLFLSLIRGDGTIHDPLEVTAGNTAFEVVLPEAPDFEPETEGADRDRTKFYVGRKDLVKVSSIADGGRTEKGAQLFALSGVIDDERVHLADVALLPESGEIQDEPQNPDDPSEGGGIDEVVNYYNHTVLYSASDPENLVNMYARLVFRNDGVLREQRGSDAVPSQDTQDFPNEWILGGAIDPSVADDFEVRFDVVTTSDPTGNCVLGGSSLGTWLGLGTGRTIEWTLLDGETDLDVTEQALVVVRCRVRDVATETVQEDRNVTLILERQA